ncbi:DUF1254 domain-containing protein [Novosphingobium sp. YJ-S2-02]|uniref:DUF1254 domain-containing protein n=1 Tax=Novosphingobium aureum TaxID=2792964 RepID=A0A931MJR4_9SPHN|nr:DUF1254 domain-containing protein [Novosphingobium aureum]MBH0111998.1 DUF1254 domain-containing protein [Novosphingobium aureum]
MTRLKLPLFASLCLLAVVYPAAARPQVAAKDSLQCRTAPGSLASATSNAEIFRTDLCDPYSLAVMAYVWGKPIVDAAKIRVFFTRPDAPLTTRPPSVAGAALNRFGHGRILADPDNKSGVGPNNDTLYSNATFDLTTGPFVVTTPDFGDRYYTFSVAHPDSSTSASLGSRTHGSKLPPLFLHAAGYAGPIPAGMVPISSADRYLHLWGRTLVTSPEDLPQVRQLQDAMKIERYVDGKLEPVGPPPPQRPFPASTGDEVFLRQLAVALEDMALSPQDQAIADRIRPLLETAQAAGESASVSKGLADGQTIIAHAAAHFGKQSGGWSVGLAGARFGSDWLLRAAVAKDQIFVTVPEEAIYPIARKAADGSELTGAHRYRLHMDAPPPARAFWSITLYDDAGAMEPNPIERYSVGNRTRGLMREDGTMRDIVIAHDEPRDRDAIWLPAPEGRFYLMMRLYGPERAIQTGEWTPPIIDQIQAL